MACILFDIPIRVGTSLKVSTPTTSQGHDCINQGLILKLLSNGKGITGLDFYSRPVVHDDQN